MDYGDGPMVRDPNSGKYRRTRLFVLTLGYSRKSVRLLTLQSSAQIWAELHETSLSTSWRRHANVSWTTCAKASSARHLRPGAEPALSDVLKHYGVVGLPCRVATPIERARSSRCRLRKENPIEGSSGLRVLAEAQTYLDRWEERWADTRIHGTTKRQVAAMFAEEKPVLQPLPLEPFRYYEYGERRCIWTAALKWWPHTTALRRAGSAAQSGCSGMTAMSD